MVMNKYILFQNGLQLVLFMSHLFLSARRALLYLVFFWPVVKSFVLFVESFVKLFLKISSFFSISNCELCLLLSLLCPLVESFVSPC